MSPEEELIEGLLNDPGTKEVLAWLRGGGDNEFRSLGELETNEDSIALVQQIYDAGAIEVLAVELDIYPEGQNTGRLVIKLPDHGATRQRVFAWAGKAAEEQGFDPDQDEGQPYIFVMLD